LKGEGDMKLKTLLKKGAIVVFIYSIVALGTLLIANRIERLEKKGFVDKQVGVTINFANR